MPNPGAITAKVDAVLRRLTITDRDVYIRRSQHLGGDPLTGRGVSTSFDDVLMDPQPAVVVAARNYPLVIAGEALSPDAEYLLTVSATAMTKDDVADPALTIVFRDSNGKDETLFIIGYQPAFIGGVDIMFSLILGSKKR